MKAVKYPQAISIPWLRKMYLKKEITPEDLIREIVRRADADTGMNIWITPPAMERLEPYLKRLASLDFENSPLWGIPFAIKDNIDLAGVATTAGCPLYSYVPDENAAVVERLLSAGAIPLGKTNMDQFATGLVGTRSPYGETHNALKKELISGGSSSGSAVAVARGHAAFALGTDTAGSGRVPAALNNLVGYKPSLGAWPVKGVVPACASLDCVTVFANSLEDALQVDYTVCGADNADPWSKDMDRPILGLPSKICLPKEQPVFFGPYANEYFNAWNTAIERLKKTGISVEYIDCTLFSEAAAILYDGPWVAERWSDLGDFIESHPGAAFPVTERILRSGGAARHSAVSVFKAVHKLQAFKLEAGKVLRDAVLAMPTCGGTWTREQVRLDPMGTNNDMGRYTNHCNLLDLCAIAVPAGTAASDIPFGITFFALGGNEALICGAAHAFINDFELPAGEKIMSRAAPAAGKAVTPIAVCGLHMRGYPLEKQMKDSGAHFVREALTAKKYQMVRLPSSPSKPGLIKRQSGGASIFLEIWEMPVPAFGIFAASVPAPLGIGKVELEDGTEVPGFICEGYASEGAEDITSFGGWRYLSR